MTVDLDALIAEAREWSADPASWGDNGLIDRLADSLEQSLAELRQEREKRRPVTLRDVMDARAALSRAEEAIEKVLAVPNEFEWDVPPTAKAILSRIPEHPKED